MNLCLYKVTKSDACVRPLFANPVSLTEEKRAFQNRCLCSEKFVLSTLNFAVGPSDSASDSIPRGDNSNITNILCNQCKQFILCMG